MPLNIARTRQLLRSFDFSRLFVEELGWDRCGNQLDISLEGTLYRLSAVAEKRGMVAYLCGPAADGRLPDSSLRRKIERQAEKSVHEHIIIYVDENKTTQVWQWVKREMGKPVTCREHTFTVSQDGLSLIQKLQSIAFSLEEEEDLTVVEVSGRARVAFDIERITKRFYDRFKAEHDAFMKFIEGIPDEELHRWYASVMLNRLMFIYFIQKKGFLDGNENFLRAKLLQSKEQGKNRFYKGFLCPLFFEGFAKKEKDRSSEINKLLGKTPYLNGGLFLKHQIEELHGKSIAIADSAFEKLFDFFDRYQWHLDERPLRRDNEINPDVLGYIFEKYINQKQMGAYYTKEDITEYISKNTVIPYLFDAAQQKCAIAFEGESSIWRLLQVDPDRYFYAAVKKGTDLPLPDNIAMGIRDISLRTEWNKPAAPEYALPTEIWREVVARRQRYEEVKAIMLKGELRSINDLITCNLDIRQFAQDVIWSSEGPELLRAFYQAIEKVTVLDPTCGSGAFLFAALNILEPLYEACLDRMQAFLDERDRSGEKHRSDHYSDFRNILKRVSDHPNLKYFIFKSIIVNNLYGVDIMEEATEICKLRLFLKLVAQIDDVNHIEPLPDIDFNIRAGNTLVGFATYEEVENATEGDWIKQQSLPAIKEKADEVDRLFRLFHQQQTELGVEATPETKRELQARLKSLEEELNQYLAGEYGIDPGKKTVYMKWLDSHKPFHWFIEFYGILKNGGFDVIIGNPPYVEYSKVKTHYTIQSSYLTLSCGNLYAPVLERSYSLLYRHGCLSFITPLSLVCTSRTEAIRDVIAKFTCWITCYDMRPSSLFEGVAQRLCILISKTARNNENHLFMGGYRRWAAEERNALIALGMYVATDRHPDCRLLGKYSSSIENSIMRKISATRLEHYVSEASNPIYVHRIVRYFIKALNFLPLFKGPEGKKGKSEDYKEFRFEPREQSQIAAILNSTLFYWFWRMHSDGFHCGYSDVYLMPYKKITGTDQRQKLTNLLDQLMVHFNKSSAIKSIKTKSGSISYQEFYPAISKSIIDEIDRVLAKRYGFTDEELDFIINYDIKYRMKLDSEEEE